MFQKVDSKKTLIYTGIGLSTGVVTGGIGGYLSKPYMKNGLVTDEFVSSYIDMGVKEDLKDMSKKSKILKQIAETGSVKDVPDRMFKDLGYSAERFKNMTSEERKEVANIIIKEGYEEFGVDNFDDLEKKVKEYKLQDLVANQKKSIAEYDKLLFTEGTEPEKMKEVIRNNAHKFNFDDGIPLEASINSLVDGKSVAEVNKFIIDEKQVQQAMFDDTINFGKKKLTEYFKGELNPKDINNESSIDVAKNIDKLARKFKLKSSAKWAGIIGGTLALVGAAVAIFTGKKNS